MDSRAEIFTEIYHLLNKKIRLQFIIIYLIFIIYQVSRCPIRNIVFANFPPLFVPSPSKILVTNRLAIKSSLQRDCNSVTKVTNGLFSGLNVP